MDANYDEVEDVKLACNDADVQGQGCADGELRPPTLSNLQESW